MRRCLLQIKVLNTFLSYPRLEVELDRDCAMALVARQRVVLKSVDHHAAWTEADLKNACVLCSLSFTIGGSIASAYPMHLFTNWALEEWGVAVFQHLLQTIPDMNEHL